MALPKSDLLTRDDLNNLLRFSSALADNYGDFINTTLRTLDEIFDLPISTYTIFAYDTKGAVTILENHSNYFTPMDLEFYNNGGYLLDTPFINSRIDFARNSNKFAFVTDYTTDANSSIAPQMRDLGIKYQVRVGSHKRGITPLHVLSIYLPDDAEAPDDHRMELFSAIGKIFSEHVGNYKRLQSADTIRRCAIKGLNTTDYGVAMYEPYTNILECNRNFSQLCREGSVRQFVEEIISSIPNAALREKPILFTRDGIQFAAQAISDSQNGDRPIFIIKTQEIQAAEPAGPSPKPALKPQYLNHGLTLREIDVIALIEAGLNNQEISERLVISISTVKTHVKNIFSKYGVNSRTELLRLLQEEA